MRERRLDIAIRNSRGRFVWENRASSHHPARRKISAVCVAVMFLGIAAAEAFIR
jgi:hypothetical protein